MWALLQVVWCFFKFVKVGLLSSNFFCLFFFHEVTALEAGCSLASQLAFSLTVCLKILSMVQNNNNNTVVWHEIETPESWILICEGTSAAIVVNYLGSGFWASSSSVLWLPLLTSPAWIAPENEEPIYLQPAKTQIVNNIVILLDFTRSHLVCANPGASLRQVQKPVDLKHRLFLLWFFFFLFFFVLKF